MGIIDLQGPFEPNLDVPGFGKLQTKTKSDIENLEGRHRALKEAIVALENDRPRNAIKLLEPFVQTETPSVDALAYIAVAMIQSNGGRSSRKTHEFATRALRMGDKHPLAHAIMSRVSELENHEAMRARHANLAIELAGDNHPRLQEVYFILDADQRAKRVALNETRDPLPLLLSQPHSSLRFFILAIFWGWAKTSISITSTTHSGGLDVCHCSSLVGLASRH